MDNRQATLERLATALKDRWYQIADTEVIDHHLSRAWEQLADAALAAVEQAAPGRAPSHHEHERGAPLTPDCDNWCRAKQAAPPSTIAERDWCATCGNYLHRWECSSLIGQHGDQEQAVPEGLRCTCGHICVSLEAWHEGEVCHHLPTCDLETEKRSDPLADARAALQREQADHAHTLTASSEMETALRARLSEARAAIREAHLLLRNHLHANGTCQRCDWLVLPTVVAAENEHERNR